MPVAFALNFYFFQATLWILNGRPHTKDNMCRCNHYYAYYHDYITCLNPLQSSSGYIILDNPIYHYLSLIIKMYLIFFQIIFFK